MQRAVVLPEQLGNTLRTQHQTRIATLRVAAPYITSSTRRGFWNPNTLRALASVVFTDYNLRLPP